MVETTFADDTERLDLKVDEWLGIPPSIPTPGFGPDNRITPPPQPKTPEDLLRERAESLTAVDRSNWTAGDVVELIDIIAQRIGFRR